MIQVLIVANHLPMDGSEWHRRRFTCVGKLHCACSPRVDPDHRLKTQYSYEALGSQRLQSKLTYCRRAASRWASLYQS